MITQYSISGHVIEVGIGLNQVPENGLSFSKEKIRLEIHTTIGLMTRQDYGLTCQFAVFMCKYEEMVGCSWHTAEEFG